MNPETPSPAPATNAGEAKASSAGAHVGDANAGTATVNASAWPVDLRACELFDELRADRVAELESQCRCARYEKGEVILRAGDDDEHSVFVLLHGRAKVSRRTPSGHNTVLAEIGPGMYFGEFGAIDGRSGSATVQAGSEAMVALIPRDIFRLLLRDEPTVALRIMERLVRLIRSLDERVAGLHGAHEEFDRLHRDLLLVNL